ncbi:hypothetical protein Taro_006196 [Colocasia esculenta]|uniref:DNA-directed RNA polymerase n=1 Tax=Colocasia esculenta TaxID=4460 RepID=A0A843U048_COLES|nr:hypothetical protein [Colocasia esculenta]
MDNMGSFCLQIAQVKSVLDRNSGMIGRAVENMITMGKLASQSGLDLPQALVGVGMTPLSPKLERAGPPEVFFVLLDGCVIGSIVSSRVEKAVSHIRLLKLSASKGIPNDLEVGYVPLSMGGAYPGLYLFTSPSRFVRPIRNLSHPSKENLDIELIGPFEQAFMEIRCTDGGDGGRSDAFPATHEEIHPTAVLSVVANLTPWSDHNQSPRNMYQCQRECPFVRKVR